MSTTDSNIAPTPPRKGLLSDEMRAEFEARMGASPTLLDYDAVEGAVISCLPPHLQSAWRSLCEHEPEAEGCFGEAISELEEEITARMRRMVLRALMGPELRDLGIDFDSCATQSKVSGGQG